MSRPFARSGIHFTYPDAWKLEVEDTDDGWAATVYSPETAFLVLSYHADYDDPGTLADSALQAMRESYPDLESEQALESLAGVPAIGHDVDFITLDLAISCSIRALTAPEGCLLVMSQSSDIESPESNAALREILASLTFDEES
jgi:hypothetical protein